MATSVLIKQALLVLLKNRLFSTLAIVALIEP